MSLPLLRFPTVEPKSSPPRRQRQGTDRFHIRFRLLKDNAEERRDKLVKEMAGGWKLRKIRRFLDFVPGWKKKAPILDLSNVPHGEGMEDEMYDEVDHSLTSSGCIPKYDFVNTSQSPDAITGTKPDGILLQQGVYETKIINPDRAAPTAKSKKKKQSSSNLNYMRYADIVFELKPCANQDPFVDPAEEVHADEEPLETMESEANAGIETRGQLIEYVTDIMSLQHRLFTFAVTITGDRARISRWDRSGSVVSTAFDYTDTDDNYLGEFLWRYSHASRAEQGFDDTVTEASSTEEQLLTSMVNNFLDHLFVGDSAHKDMLRNTTLDPRWPTHRMTVFDEESETASDYIVRRPFSEVLSPCGRSTRAYLAYSIGLKKVVFLKDTWRTETDGVPAESEAYDVLRKAGVSNLPTVIASGDVKNKDGTRQETLTDQVPGYYESEDDEDGTAGGDNVKRSGVWFRRHIHHRVVQEFALPLHFARSSKELVVALRDVLETILHAYRDGHILHRDISAGNIMLSETFKAILNDWDHSVWVPIKHTPRVYRTGTWAFMSIDLLQGPKLHSILDDVESCYWVLLFVASRYFAIGLLQNSTLFDEVEEAKDAQGRTVVKGGTAKTTHIHCSQYESLEWSSKPLTRVVHAFGKLLTNYHLSKRLTSAMLPEPLLSEMQKKNREALENVVEVIKVFDDAINSTDWPEQDSAIGKPQVQTSKQQRQANLAGHRLTRSMPTTSIDHPSAAIASHVPAAEGPMEAPYRTRPVIGVPAESTNPNFSTGDKRTHPDDHQGGEAPHHSTAPSRTKRARKDKEVVREPMTRTRTKSQGRSTKQEGPASRARSRTNSAEGSRPVVPHPRRRNPSLTDDQRASGPADATRRRTRSTQSRNVARKEDAASSAAPPLRRVTRSSSRNANGGHENLPVAGPGPMTRMRTKSINGRL